MSKISLVTDGSLLNLYFYKYRRVSIKKETSKIAKRDVNYQISTFTYYFVDENKLDIRMKSTISSSDVLI